jgi:hypothetical protein
MWQTSLGIDKKEKISQCVAFMSDTDLFEACMMRVVTEWPISCEANLTNSGVNQVAWLGQAAAAIGIECPEDITKESWGYLPDSIKDKANAAAKKHIKQWKENYLEKIHA